MPLPNAWKFNRHCDLRISYERSITLNTVPGQNYSHFPWSPVHTYPGIFVSAIFFMRTQKCLRPHEAYTNRIRPSTRIRFVSRHLKGLVNRARAEKDRFLYCDVSVTKIGSLLWRQSGNQWLFVNKVKVLGCSCRIEATKTPSFRENRTSLLCAFDSGVINEEEFVLLYDINTAKSPDLPYWDYEWFDLDNHTDEVCKAEFRLYKNDVYNLMEVFHLPDQFTCYNGLKLDGLEGFCMLLKRYAYPCRYLDMITRFARPVPQLCMASILVIDYSYTAWGRLLTNLNQPWLSPVNLERFANAVFKKRCTFIELHWLCWWYSQASLQTWHKSTTTLQWT